MWIPLRNAIIRLLLQYPDDEMCATPFLWSTDTNLFPLLLCLGLSVSWWGTCESPQTTTQPILASLPSPLLSCCFSSTLQLIIFPSPNRIAHFPLTSENETERGGKKKKSTNFLNPIDLLCQTFLWEFTLAKRKSLKRKCFSFPPTASYVFLKNSPLSLSAGGHFPRILNLCPHH